MLNYNIYCVRVLLVPYFVSCDCFAFINREGMKFIVGFLENISPVNYSQQIKLSDR